MKFSKRRFFAACLAFFVCVLPVALGGCASVRDEPEGIPRGFPGTADSLPGGKDDGGGSPGKPSVTPVPVTAGSLPVPASYDEAYSYRMDAADKTASALLKDRTLDALRSTDAAGYVRSVAERIQAAAQNDFERAKLAHDVTALLISYDAASFWAGTVPAQDFASVLKTRKAVCEGYAAVFKKFCDALELPCQVVHGYARGVGTTLATENDVSVPNHAWNIVQLGGEWYLVDCTWDSGYMSGRTVRQRYTTDWLFLRPEHFVYTHFPEQKRHQLLASPLSVADFAALPDLRPKFFDVATNVTPFPSRTNQTESGFSLSFSEADGFQLDFTVTNASSGSQAKNCFIVRRHADGNATADFSFPAAGLYEVDVFWRKTGAGRADGCGQFLVQAADASSVRYPTLYAVSGDVQLLGPLEMPLAAGTSVGFRVAAPRHKFVAVICGRTYNQLADDGTGLFSGDITIPRGLKEISVGVSDSERGRYQIVATYSVR